MGKKHGAKEQKRLAKKKAKLVAKHKKLARQNSTNPAIRLAHSDQWPIHEALVPVRLWESGIGNLLISRHMPDGKIAMAAFLVDAYCLGIKDAFWHIMAVSEYEAQKGQIAERVGPFKAVTPEYFSKLVHQAADYGQSLGFAPHRDFRHARLLLAGIDPSLCPDEYEFGFEGKPMFVSGPHDSPEMCRLVAQKVQDAGGHFVIGAGGHEVDWADLAETDEFDEVDDNDDSDDGDWEIDEDDETIDAEFRKLED